MDVDFLVESNGALVPLEVRLSATPTPGMTFGIASLRKDLVIRPVLAM